MKNLRRLLILFLGVLIVGLSDYSSKAQNDSCPAIVTRALEVAAQSCDSLGRNEVCYGHTLVEAAFNNPLETAFSQPADRASVRDLKSLRTFPLDETLGLWGVALMNVQANLPETLPGQAVRFILYGDVSIENRGEELPPLAQCSATVNLPANLRNGPGERYPVATSVPAGTTLTIGGRSQDGRWLFTIVNHIPGWIAADLVTVNCNTAALPVRQARDVLKFGPMQAFYFTTGSGTETCKEMPSTALVIQSPKGYTVRLNANGVNLTIGSTIALTATKGDKMTISTLEGKAVTQQGGVTQVIPAGYEASVELGGTNGLIPVGAVKKPQQLDTQQWQSLADSASEVLDTPVDLPETTNNQSLEDFCLDPTNASACATPETPVCGDLLCEAGEDASTCAVDCFTAEPVCGDLLCEVGENETLCPADCATPAPSICGDFVCSVGEDASTCAADCTPTTSAPQCGDLTCDVGETASTCPADCPLPTAVPPICGNLACEAGEDTSTCPADCPPPPTAGPVCGNLSCEAGEDSGSCSVDCAPPTQSSAATCGNFACELGEDYSLCPSDCAAPPSQTNTSMCGNQSCEAGEDVNSCPADCVLLPPANPVCGNLTCEAGEDAATCPTDCSG